MSIQKDAYRNFRKKKLNHRVSLYFIYTDKFIFYESTLCLHKLINVFFIVPVGWHFSFSSSVRENKFVKHDSVSFH